jgi:hypothetical protein
MCPTGVFLLESPRLGGSLILYLKAIQIAVLVGPSCGSLMRSIAFSTFPGASVIPFIRGTSKEGKS